MSTTLKTSLFVVLFALIIAMQYNLDSDKTATRQLKNALELAVHDAAIAVEPEALAEGKIVFDQLQAMENFEKSLEKNLNVTGTGVYVYKPNEDSFFQNDLYIVELEFIDDSNPSNSYPFVYTDSSYNIIETIDGPSIVAVIQTESPRWFTGKKTYIRQAAVYEYKK